MKKQRLIILTLILALIILVFTSCSAANKNDASGMAPAPEYNGDKESGIITDGTISDIPDGHLVIKTANETIETKQYDELIDYLRARTAELGGYISSSDFYDNSYNTRYNRNAYIVARIPADKFDEFVSDVGGFGTVTYFTEQVQDVTLEYIDVDSRIKVLEAEETALSEILAKATSLNDILLVRESLKDVQAELASLRAQKNRLDNDIAYSTARITVREVETITEQDEEKGFFPELGDRFVDSLGAVGDFFRGFALFIFGESPVLLLIGAIGVGIFLLIRFLVRRKRAKKENKD